MFQHVSTVPGKTANIHLQSICNMVLIVLIEFDLNRGVLAMNYHFHSFTLQSPTVLKHIWRCIPFSNSTAEEGPEISRRAGQCGEVFGDIACEPRDSPGWSGDVRGFWWNLQSALS